MHADTWRRRLPLYVGASVAWSVVHVVGMVLVRKAGYLLVGDHYEIEDWLRRFAYEYLKDARTFALIVIVDHGYRWFWRRLQGEARLLDPPDDGSATGQEARPERFLVRKLGREFLVAASDIEWLQAAGHYGNLGVRGCPASSPGTGGPVDDCRACPACSMRPTTVRRPGGRRARSAAWSASWAAGSWSPPATSNGCRPPATT